MNSREALIWLNNIKGVTIKVTEKLENYYGSLGNVWLSSNNEINNIRTIPEKVRNEIINKKNKTYFDNMMENIERNHVKTITILDKDFPKKLKNIYSCPKVLYVRGDMLKSQEHLIGIVGSRKATAYGKHITQKLANELSDFGITLVSGMAKGVDTEAHLAYVKKNKRNIAVLGCGVDVVYPKSNRYIYEKIIENGSVISEFPLGTPPLRYNFPQRNRIISGLSSGVLVIEANERSGSLITAHQAAEQGKDVFAVPGNINSIYSRGTNLLIKDGAKIVLGVEDIIEEIREFKDLKNRETKIKIDYSKLSKDEVEIISCIEEPIHTDLICLKTGMPISSVNSILTILEMKGIVRKLPNQLFTTI